MATNFTVKGKFGKSPKEHYIVLREHEKSTENELHRLEDKLKKHEELPASKAHGKSQKDAPLPNMRKY